MPVASVDVAAHTCQPGVGLGRVHKLCVCVCVCVYCDIHMRMQMHKIVCVRACARARTRTRIHVKAPTTGVAHSCFESFNSFHWLKYGSFFTAEESGPP